MGVQDTDFRGRAVTPSRSASRPRSMPRSCTFCPILCSAAGLRWRHASGLVRLPRGERGARHDAGRRDGHGSARRTDRPVPTAFRSNFRSERLACRVLFGACGDPGADRRRTQERREHPKTGVTSSGQGCFLMTLNPETPRGPGYFRARTDTVFPAALPSSNILLLYVVHLSLIHI